MLKLDLVTTIVWWIDYNRGIKLCVQRKGVPLMQTLKLHQSCEDRLKMASTERDQNQNTTFWTMLLDLSRWLNVSAGRNICLQNKQFCWHFDSNEPKLWYGQYLSTAHCYPLVKSAIQHPLKFPLKKWVGPWGGVRIREGIQKKIVFF